MVEGPMENPNVLPVSGAGAPDGEEVGDRAVDEFIVLPSPDYRVHCATES